MEIRKTALERAFELAKSGRCRDLFELKMRLKSEKYGEIYAEGKALKTQLIQLIEKSREQYNVE